MSAHLNRLHGALLLGLAISLAVSRFAHAEQPKGDSSEPEAEAKQAAEEDAQEQGERAKGIKGKWQRIFSGTFRRISDPEAAQALSPQVVGTFVTDVSDKKPGRSYLVKAEGKTLLTALNRFDGKRVRLAGKLRNVDPEGEAKYLVVSDVILEAETPPAVEHRAFGGI